MFARSTPEFNEFALRLSSAAVGRAHFAFFMSFRAHIRFWNFSFAAF
jgi:hypothetical protein